MKKNKTYETYLEELEKIMAEFDNNELSLDESLIKYEKALELIKILEQKLNEAQGKLKDVQEKNK